MDIRCPSAKPNSESRADSARNCQLYPDPVFNFFVLKQLKYQIRGEILNALRRSALRYCREHLMDMTSTKNILIFSFSKLEFFLQVFTQSLQHHLAN